MTTTDRNMLRIRWTENEPAAKPDHTIVGLRDAHTTYYAAAPNAATVAEVADQFARTYDHGESEGIITATLVIGGRVYAWFRFGPQQSPCGLSDTRIGECEP